MRIMVDGNEAAASVAYRTNEVIAIYPITPSSPMGELSDTWASQHRHNVWGTVPEVVEMQSEGGAAGAVHGALQAGALTTTFTASQGLLLMVPNLYKIAGELTGCCIHVAARTLATHALSIFGDHSDVMACRQTGFAMLCSSSVQEAHDFALIGQSTALRTRVPFLHFFDGFRTSHEVAAIERLSDEQLRAMIGDDVLAAHRARALCPDRPVLRGSAQNPDVFFQAREACTPFHAEVPRALSRCFEELATLTGRRYRLFDYEGHPDAERVVVAMGSGAQTFAETARWLAARGEKVGVVTVRLYRPFFVGGLLAALPGSTRSIAVLDRTKEPGSIGEPLYLDVIAALREGRDEGITVLDPCVIGGRYGLGSKELTPGMARAVFDECARARPKRHFTIGIVDDVSKSSLDWDPSLDIEPADRVRAVFFGLGSDGTVSANKNAIRIIGEETPNYAQGYFVYDSKKSGAVTISHLRFGPTPIAAPYLVGQASFVACHHFGFFDRYDVLSYAAPGAVLLVNAPYEADEVWDRLPREVQEQVIAKNVRLWSIDANRVARAVGLEGRINTIMQTCFFAISGVLPRDEAIARVKDAIEKSYGKRGGEMVDRNFAAVDHAVEHLWRVEVPADASSTRRRPPVVSEAAPDFVQRVTAVMLANQGDLLPVSAFPVDGTWPTGTTQWEKRNLADEIPVWDAAICIQCNKCALVCPHAAIRAKVYEPSLLERAPAAFLSADYKGAEHRGQRYTIQVAPEDCTGCRVCVAFCPAKDKSNPRHKAIDMAPAEPLVAQERESYSFFLSLPETDRARVKLDVKGSQLLQPLFEYSGACSGCGETPYIKLLTQLFGDRTLIANATGCTSIYGGNLPTTPYTVNADGRGPAWSNSLFEDNAEFGYGMRLAADVLERRARDLLTMLAHRVGDALAAALLNADQTDEKGIAAQRERVGYLRIALAGRMDRESLLLHELADYLVKKSVWLVGGDGWAYDIGYGGLDHVMASGRDVNVLVLDTEVYSNTGGQQSKATPLGASAKFAEAGKSMPKKDLGLMAMTYGRVYVARIAFGANDSQTVKAFLEAESYPGTSLIIAYSHCIAHGYDMEHGPLQQKLAVETGAWPLYRFDPRRVPMGEPPLRLDSKAPKGKVVDYTRNEARFRVIEKTDPDRHAVLRAAAQRHVDRRWSMYDQLATIRMPRDAEAAEPGAARPGPEGAE